MHKLSNSRFSQLNGSLMPRLYAKPINNFGFVDSMICPYFSLALEVHKFKIYLQIYFYRYSFLIILEYVHMFTIPIFIVQVGKCVEIGIPQVLIIIVFSQVEPLSLLQ